MVNDLLEVDENIEKAQTISKIFYTDQKLFDLQKIKIFENNWQFLTDIESVKIPGQYFVSKYIESFIDEPILLTRDYSDKIHCLSNVCTHRGTILAEFNGHTPKNLRCRYHGRRFNLDGCFHSMTEMDEAENFPSESDNLAKIPFNQWGKFIFASLNPTIEFSDWIGPLENRINFLPINEFLFDSKRSRDYLINANWALYVENYLEGFHIPYIHPGLANALDYNSYKIELFKFSNLQIGIATGSENIFILPETHVDFGKRVAAYYFWLFPNIMLNFYPWGLSINIVKPISIDKTRISYLTYVWKENLMDFGAGSQLDKVEREDEAVVEQVQLGIKSKYYLKGRYSPKQEKGVHHFHRLLAQFMK